MNGFSKEWTEKQKFKKKIWKSEIILLAAILMPYVHGISLLHLASSSGPQDSKDASRATWKKVKARVPNSSCSCPLLALQLRDWKMLEASKKLNNLNRDVLVSKLTDLTV